MPNGDFHRDYDKKRSATGRERLDMQDLNQRVTDLEVGLSLSNKAINKLLDMMIEREERTDA